MFALNMFYDAGALCRNGCQPLKQFLDAGLCSLHVLFLDKVHFEGGVSWVFLSVSLEATSHLQHLFGFSPLCVSTDRGTDQKGMKRGGGHCTVAHTGDSWGQGWPSCILTTHCVVYLWLSCV